MFQSRKTKECLENQVYIRLIINKDMRITKYKYDGCVHAPPSQVSKIYPL